MEFVQVAFVVPEWVRIGLNEGNFRIIGGIVRNNLGQIVYHLKDAQN